VGPNWIIEDGLQAGDKVVIEGIQQAKEGTTVNPKPWSPSAQTNTPPAMAMENGSTNQPPK
jgi:membrane fusion protein (multidrug efflux system)